MNNLLFNLKSNNLKATYANMFNFGSDFSLPMGKNYVYDYAPEKTYVYTTIKEEGRLQC